MRQYQPLSEEIRWGTMSPMFQKFIKTVYKHYGTNIPRGLREEFRKGSLPLMKYTNILTFNSRAIMLCFTMLTGELWMYLIFELVVLMALFLYMQKYYVEGVTGGAVKG